MPEPLLALQGVSRRYGGVLAVDGVNSRVAAGELLGVIGPNGAGKTTLFNLISGFARPSAGSVRLRGRRIDRLPAHRIARLGVCRTFQNLRLSPTLSVLDNVSVGATGAVGFAAWRAVVPGAAARRSRLIAARCCDALDRVALADRAHASAATLSYGQRKYLEIARALATRPELLILDEPAAGLDETETAALAGFIGGLNGGGTTVLLVEHDMGLVMGTCRRVAVLASGRKIADATPAEVRADPAVQLAYLYRNAAGTVRLAGRDILSRSPHEIVAAGISQAPEGRHNFAAMTVAENLRIGTGPRPRREQAKDTKRIFGLFPVLRQRVGQSAGSLSGGEQQMLCTGRAMMARPRLLLLDEPSLGLAPRLVRLIFDLIARIREGGTAILLVEQNAHAALRVADHAYVMEGGRIVLDRPAAAMAGEKQAVRRREVDARHRLPPGMRRQQGRRQGDGEHRRQAG